MKIKLSGFVSIFAAVCLLFIACPGSQIVPTVDGGVDKTVLQDAIVNAEILFYSVKATSNDGSGLATGTEYVSQAARSTFEAAIATAKNVLEFSEVSQADVDARIFTLNTAKSIFINAINKAGTVNKKPLATLITDAAALLAAVNKISDNGAGFTPGTDYVSQSSHDEFAAAIASAQTAHDKPAASQAEINNALGELIAAKDAFKKAVKTVPGGTVDKSALQAGITQANTTLNSVQHTDNPGSLPQGTWYVSESDWNVFVAAICAAQLLFDNPDETQSAVNAALTVLNTARDTFEGLVQRAGGPDANDQSNYKWEWTIDIPFGGGWGENVYAIYTSWSEVRNGPKILGLPAGSYFRVVFDGLDGNWPDTIWDGSANRKFKNEFLTFALRGYNGPFVYIDLAAYGKVDEDGKGEIFFAADLIKNFMQDNPDTPWATHHEIGYRHYDLRPGDFGNPKIFEYEGAIAIEAWVPVNGGGVLKNALQTAISSAEDLLYSVTPSNANGAGLAAGTKYVTTAAYNAFSTVIDSAKSTLNNASITLTQANNSVIALNNARKTFLSLYQTVGSGPNPFGYRLTATTSHPYSHVFILNSSGNDWIEITVSNIDTAVSGNFDVDYTISDFFGAIVKNGSVGFNTLGGSTQTKQIPLGKSKQGYFTFKASIQGGPASIKLDALGTRPTGWINYVVLPDPSTRRMNAPANYPPYSVIQPGIDKSVYFGLNIVPGGGESAFYYNGELNPVTYFGLDATINAELNWGNENAEGWGGNFWRNGATDVIKLNDWGKSNGSPVSTLKQIPYVLAEIAYFPVAARTEAGKPGSYGGQLSPYGEGEFRKYCEGLAKIYIVHASHRPLHYYQMTWEPVSWWNGWAGSDESLIRVYEIAYEAIHRIYNERAAGTLTLPDGTKPAADSTWRQRPVILGPTLSDVTGNLNKDLHDSLIDKGLVNYIDGFSAHLYDYNENSQAGGTGSVGNGNDVSLANGIKYLVDKVNSTYSARNTAQHPKYHDKLYFWGTEMGVKEAAAGSGRPLWAGQVLSRYSLIALGEGFEANHIFCFNDYDADNRYGLFYNCTQMRDGNEQHGPEYISPKHLASSFAAITHLMKGYVTNGRITGLGGSKMGYKYQDTWNGTSSSGPFIYALWDHNGVSSNITLNLDESGTITVYDIVGNVVKTGNGNKVQLDVTENVLYVKVEP